MCFLHDALRPVLPPETPHTRAVVRRVDGDFALGRRREVVLVRRANSSSRRADCPQISFAFDVARRLRRVRGVIVVLRDDDARYSPPGDASCQVRRQRRVEHARAGRRVALALPHQRLQLDRRRDLAYNRLGRRREGATVSPPLERPRRPEAFRDRRRRVEHFIQAVRERRHVRVGHEPPQPVRRTVGRSNTKVRVVALRLVALAVARALQRQVEVQRRQDLVSAVGVHVDDEVEKVGQTVLLLLPTPRDEGLERATAQQRPAMPILVGLALRELRLRRALLGDPRRGLCRGLEDGIELRCVPLFHRQVCLPI
mmetsp:Transcript_8915/g.25696  ORF Transcript_8915/g.25696 Transcript_8915/m.25696 type:complete len:313 (+) Transcript_8915:807-1745(+)